MYQPKAYVTEGTWGKGPSTLMISMVDVFHVSDCLATSDCTSWSHHSWIDLSRISKDNPSNKQEECP